jgi:hypothetical protein
MPVLKNLAARNALTGEEIEKAFTSSDVNETIESGPRSGTPHGAIRYIRTKHH